LSFILVPILEFEWNFLPPKCYELSSVPQLFILLLFSPWIRNWVYQGVWGCINFYTIFWIIGVVYFFQFLSFYFFSFFLQFYNSPICVNIHTSLAAHMHPFNWHIWFLPKVFRYEHTYPPSIFGFLLLFLLFSNLMIHVCIHCFIFFMFFLLYFHCIFIDNNSLHTYV